MLINHYKIQGKDYEIFIVKHSRSAAKCRALEFSPAMKKYSY